jgi:hypothetical protein
MRYVYAVFCTLALGLYAVSSLRGWDLATPKRGFLPASVRQAPGGYRSHEYWRGGK